jgi:hypothetical protein
MRILIYLFRYYKLWQEYDPKGTGERESSTAPYLSKVLTTAVKRRLLRSFACKSIA